MSDRETVIVGSGKHWLNGKESSEKFFERAQRSASQPSSSMSYRLLDLLYRLVEGRRKS